MVLGWDWQDCSCQFPLSFLRIGDLKGESGEGGGGRVASGFLVQPQPLTNCLLPAHIVHSYSWLSDTVTVACNVHLSHYCRNKQHHLVAGECKHKKKAQIHQSRQFAGGALGTGQAGEYAGH